MKQAHYFIALSILFSNVVLADARNVDYPVPAASNILAANRYSGQYCTNPNTYAIVGYIGATNNSGVLNVTTSSDAPTLCSRTITWSIAPYKSTSACFTQTPAQLQSATVSSNNTSPSTVSGTSTITYTSGSANFFANANNIRGQVCTQVQDGPDTFLLFTCGALQGNPNFVSCCYTTTGGSDPNCTIQGL